MNKQILLIDDDIDELYIFREALNETPDRVDCIFAENVEEGMRVLNELQPDFIFIDINMPRIGGFEGLLQIRDLQCLRLVPVIMYSTAINEEITKKALALGASACIKKTDSVTNLTSILIKLLNGSLMPRQTI